MNTKFSEPMIGQQLRVTTRWPDHFIHSTTAFRDNILVGTVIANVKFSRPGTFRMRVDCPHVPEREIVLERVVDIQPAKVVDKPTKLTNEPAKAEVQVDETWRFEGSKGKVYTVSRVGKKYTCNCPGAQFRKFCKHITEAKSAK